MTEHFGEYIKRARLRNGYPIEAVERVVGFPALKELEQHVHCSWVNADFIEKLAAVYGINVNKLLIISRAIPEDCRPKYPGDILIYRLIQKLPPDDRRDLLALLQAKVG